MVRCPMEGDLIESIDNLIFDVKGFLHPSDRVIAYVRFVPSVNGDRIRCDLRFRKIYSLFERDSFIKSHFPEYMYYDMVFNREVEAVPIDKIREHYDPVNRTLQMARSRDGLDYLESLALSFVEFLSDISNVPIVKIGVTGSLLVKLHKSSSDIDVIVYGKDYGYSIYHALRESLMKSTFARRYNLNGLWSLYNFRFKDTRISFTDFIRVESRKVLQGLVGNTDFYIRLVKDVDELDEKYGDKHFFPIGRCRIRAKVIDSSEAIFTPCRYLVDDVYFINGKSVSNLIEIFSLRGRFCECAFKNEWIIAEGEMERVECSDGSVYHRLYLGNSVYDFIVPK